MSEQTEQKKILVVEDEKILARTINIKLSNAGFETAVTTNGKEALDAIKKDKFDLIILDLMMPEMNGFELLAELKKMDNKTTIMVTSNLSQPEDEKKAKDLGAKSYFVKSDTSLVEIVDYVKNLLEA